MAKKKPITVKSCHYVHTEDIDPDATKGGGDLWEGFINICVKAAEEALEAPPKGLAVSAELADGHLRFDEGYPPSDPLAGETWRREA